MTSWFTEAPTSWRVTRLDRVARAWPSNVDKHSVEGQLPVRLCNYTDVYKHDRITGSMAFMPATATPEQVQRFRLRIGDTLITKDSETADDIGIPSFVETDSEDLVCGYHLAMVRPDASRADPRYLYWALASGPTLRQWELVATGVTRVGIKSADLSRVQLAMPASLPEQRAIADYLDRETAQIDTLIEEQQRLIDLLHERRAATVDQSVDVGQILELRRVIADLRQGWSPNCEPWAADGITEWAVLKTGVSNSGTFMPGENKRLPDSETPRPDLAVKKDEIVMSRSNTKDLVGAASVVPGHYPRLLLSDLTYGLTLLPGTDPAFVAYALGSGPLRAQISAASKGTSPSMQKISQRDIRDLRIALPGLEEQRRIAAYLDEQTAKIDQLIAETERFIELSRERCSALITAAVTGQIDVRDEVT